MAKTDRRKWNKANSKNIDFEYPDVSEDIRKRYDDYLTNLHLHNQVAKVYNEKDPKETKLHQKENGFSLYVNGAHKQPDRFTPRHAISGTARNNRFNHRNNHNQHVPVNFVAKLHIRKEQTSSEQDDRCKSAPATRRKQWLNSSITIKTMDGLNIKLCAPPQRSLTQRDNKTENDDYSDDFEEDSSDDGDDGVNKNKTNFSVNNKNKNNDEELIKSVQFVETSASEVSDMEIEAEKEQQQHQEKQKNKKCLRLSKADVKYLRESINSFNISLSEDSLEDEIEIDCKLYDKQANIKHSGDYKPAAASALNSTRDTHRIEKPNSKCNLLLENISNLDTSERKVLLKFLKSIDGDNDFDMDE